jgi:putative ATP-dependent endonuclease of OLD family
MTPAGKPGAMRLAAARVQDFRGITDICISFDDMTVLVGENNVGKSSLLAALEVALTSSRPTDDDLRVDAAGSRASEFVVDLRLEPGTGDEFEEAAAVRLGDAVRLPATGKQFVVLRCRGRGGVDGSELTKELRFLADWSCDRAVAATVTELRPATRGQLSLLSFFLLDARRDMLDELRLRRSYWGRLLADVGINDADRAALEAQLLTLGSEVVRKSTVLSELHKGLARIQDALGTAVQQVALEAVPSRLEELAKAVDVLLQAPGSAALPLRVQGMGARSLAVVMVFQAFTQMRLGQGQDVAPMPLAAFEEPEAHLHPHPQRAMFKLIEALPGQKIVSTHSPYITQVADLFAIRSLTRSAGVITCAQVPVSRSDGSPLFDDEGKDKARRFVQQNNGEVLFARCVILYEGETEDGALPVFARSRWGAEPATHGVSIVSTSGVGNLKHFIPVLEHLSVPWLALTDGDTAADKAVAAVEHQLERSLLATEVFRMPAGTDFEQYLLQAGYSQQLQAGISAVHGTTALDDWRNLMHGQNKNKMEVRDYQSSGWENRLIEDYCKMHMKTPRGGGGIATAIADAVAVGTQPSLPDPILRMLEQAETIIGLTP